MTDHIHAGRYMKAVIYQDNVSSNGILYYSLSRLLGNGNVAFANAREIDEGVLQHNVQFFIMPGGASRYKEAKLRGRRTELIKSYIASGGTYIGICAGAYMACEFTEWGLGTRYELICSNELGLFPGKAVGPIKDFSSATSYNGSDARIVELNFGTHRRPLLYWGGCRFESHPNGEFFTVASFSELHDSPPAIVRGRYGKGQWLLSSVHLEYDAQALELIRFDVKGNAYEDIAALNNWHDLSLDTLASLLDDLTR